MARKISLRIPAAFFERYDLYMPPGEDARRAIHHFVTMGNGNWLIRAATAEERAAALRAANEEWRGRLLMRKGWYGAQVLLYVLYILPKTGDELRQQQKERVGARGKLKVLNPIYPYKARVDGSNTTMRLDTFVWVKISRAAPAVLHWSVRRIC